MEIRAFAERVLFATTMTEKLAPPDGPLTDDNPGAMMLAPGMPGRPADLIPRARGDGRATFPGIAKLVDETARARLLHFFCNHELLAVELMALALLRFPDAPKSFRRGVAHTLQEEQAHTQWYSARMLDCGLKFGDIPVSKMIWDRIAPMESPLEFVSRLSLTFEQSNLDYARHYERVLADAGDQQSAAILHQIYHDEIAHVGHGLKWLRRWKEEKESDWDAFRRGLKHPLSPVRAKGLVEFNEAGRRAAGLDEDFITRLRVFEQSRGRTPDVWWFNPLAEEEWGAHHAGRAWHPSKRAESLAADLEAAFALMPPRDDVVLVRRLPSTAHRAALAALGLPLPELVEIDDRVDLADRRLHAARPWAWSPSCTAIYTPLIGSMSRQPVATDPWWFSKQSAHTIARSLPTDNQCPNAVAVDDADTARAAAIAMHADGWSTVVAKAAHGLAGRGHKFWHAGAEPPALEDHPMLIEPWLPKVFEFSAHYDCSAGDARFVGLVRQSTDARGRWQACATGPKFLKGLAPAVAAFASQVVLPAYEGVVQDALTAMLRDHPHDGPLGVDAFVWSSPDGTPHLHAVVEINPRWSMGRLTYVLGKRLSPHRWLHLRYVPTAEAVLLPAPVMTDSHLTAGAILLTDPSQAHDRVVVVSVSDGP